MGQLHGGERLDNMLLIQVLLLALSIVVVQGKLSPGGDSYDDLESGGERWNPVRVNGYVLKHREDHGEEEHEDSDVIEHVNSDRVSEDVKNQDGQNKNIHGNFDEDLELENIILNHSFDRIVQKMLKDRKPHGNKHKLVENTLEGTDTKIAPTSDKILKILDKNLKKKKKKYHQPDVLTERMDSIKADKDQETNNNIFFNLKSFMLNNLMEHPVKKTASKTKFKKVNQFKITPKPQSKQIGVKKHLNNMPVFPNFPQKAVKQSVNTFMFQPTRTTVHEPHKKETNKNNAVQPFIDPFLIGTLNEPETKQTDIKLEEINFGFKLFPVDNFDSVQFKFENSKQDSKPQKFVPTSVQLKIHPQKQQQKSKTSTPFARPTFKPMFSVTPFVTSFIHHIGGGGGQHAGGGGGGGQHVGGGDQIRREYKATPLPSYVRTTQETNYEIFR